MQTPEKIVGIYHKDCTDGTVAAAVLLKKFPRAILFPFAHGRTPEEFEDMLSKIENGAVVYIVDFSIPNETEMYELTKRASQVINIDHHAGAEPLLRRYEEMYDNFTLVFDTDHSGASLTWLYFFKNEPMPRLIEITEDLDLWKWRHVDEETVHAFGKASIFFFNEPEKAATYLSQNIDALLETGKTIQQFSEKLIAEFIKKTEETSLKIGEHTVRGYDAPGFLVSEIGHQLSLQYNEAIALFTIRGNMVYFSFRSTGELSPRALELAQTLGGGGHPNAAGARITLEAFCGMIQK